MTPVPSLHDARVVVIGGSSGIGRAVAAHAARAGAQVCVAARREAELASLCNDSARSHAITADVTVPEDCRRIIAESVGIMGGIDLVVYAAGTGTLARLVDADPDAWHRDYAVNVIGPTLVCGAALAELAPNGLVSFISSEAVTETRWGLSSYAASKAALDATIRSWRVEHPERRFQRIVMGATIGTDFGTGFDMELITAGMDRWVSAGVSMTMMDADDVGQQLTEVFAVLLAHPNIDVPDLCLDPRGDAWPSGSS